MERDLDGYTAPGLDGKDERQTVWRPGGFSLERGPLGPGCACPCNIAHPDYLTRACDVDGHTSVARVSIWSNGQTSHLLPLCAPCAAAQLYDRWEFAKADAAIWRQAQSAPGFAAVLVIIAAVLLRSWAVAGIAGGLVLSMFIISLGHERALHRNKRP
ncbi:hypothetical protein ABZX65_26960 [Streptomyces sp. NPDC003300]|uniref:hypothetical protein n=1 Tax=unclassified Streptomyces TaxID=2593676 RepID=UPI0033AA1DEE